jgi:PAS domain S-box-containing protein
MSARALILASFATAVLLVSVITWYALDFSWSVDTLLKTPSNVPATLMVLWGVCVVSLAVLVALILTAFVRPLAHLRAAALRVADGNLAVYVPRSGGTEIRDLQDAFQVMIKGLSYRALAEDERRRAEERYRIVFDHANLGIAQTSADHTILSVNPAFERLLGYSRIELLGRSWLDLVDAEDRERASAIAERIITGEFSTHNMEKRYRRKDGSAIWAEVTVAAVRRADGGVETLVTTAQDITARREAELATETSEARLRLLLEATEEGIFAVDRNGTCILCNPAAAAMLGYDSPAEIIGRNSHALVHHSYPDGSPYPAPECPISSALGKGQVSRVTSEVFWRKDGSSFPVEYAIHPMVQGSDIVGAVVSFIDIAERLTTEAAMRHAQKMEALGSLTGGIAHEINNLLLPILTLAGLTLKELPPDSRARLRLEKIADAAGRAKELVARMTAFAHYDGMATTREVVDLGAMAARLLTLMRPSIPPTIEMAEDTGGGAAMAAVDVAAMEAVVVNLISNAVDAMAATGGRLSVTVRPVVADDQLRLRAPGLRDGRYVCLSVADTGKGMDDATLKRIFDPFFTTKEVGAGTGLGLAVVHSVLGAHGGAVAVSSKAGEGTVFDAYLPAAAG